MSYKKVPLAKALTFIRGITFKPDDKVEPFSEDSVVCMRTKNIQKSLDDSDILAVPSEFVKRDEQVLEQGDLLISSANSWELVGKVVRVPKLDYKATAGGFISILRPNRELVDPDYLYRFISLDDTQHSIRHLGRQTTNISNLDRKRFLELEIPLPPLDVQKQIAAVLEKADILRNQCQQMAQELNALAQSVFLDMFGDPVNNPKGWEKLSIGELAEVKGGLQVTHRREVNPLEVPYLRVANVYRDHLDLEEIKKIKVTKQELERTRLLPGDMLVVEGHGNKLEIGRTAIWNGAISDCTHQNHLIRVRFDSKRIRSQFVSCYLNSEGGRLQILALSKTTSGLNTISTNNVRSISLIVPPLDMQDRFLTIYEKQQEKLNLIKELEFQLNSNFSSLMQRAFKGELKLESVA